MPGRTRRATFQHTSRVDLGGEQIVWSWVDDAHELEMPVIDFRYGRVLRSLGEQRSSGSPVVAEAKYTLTDAGAPAPDDAELVEELEGIAVWRHPDALPFAFTTADVADVTAAHAEAAGYAGTNRVVVRTAATPAGSERLVVLVSDHPGWRLHVDGRPADVVAVNGYLGAVAQAGAHTDVFDFDPPGYELGRAVSVATLAAALTLVATERRPRRIAT